MLKEKHWHEQCIIFVLNVFQERFANMLNMSWKRYSDCSLNISNDQKYKCFLFFWTFSQENILFYNSANIIEILFLQVFSTIWM